MKKLTMITAILLTANLLMAQIINIPADYPTIQEGIDAAYVGDTVLVHPGTYFENISIWEEITLASLFLTTGDTSYISRTIIDGNEEGCVLDIWQPTELNIIITVSGFTIQNGRSEFWNSGGGIHYQKFEPLPNDTIILKNLVIKDNYADVQGGGIYLRADDYDSLTYILIEDVVIENNLARSGSNGRLSGGGIYCENLSPVLNRVRIKNNNCGYFNAEARKGIGGCFVNSAPVIRNTIIHSNGDSGFGVYGVYFEYSTPLLQNILTFNNKESEICSSNSDITIHNATIIDNQSEFAGLSFGGSATISNSIIWSDGASPIYYSGMLSVQYSNIKDGIEGISGSGTLNWLEGNIDQDPLFLDSGGHPYQLLGGSPCIDAGTPDTTGLNLPWLDLMGNYRLWDGDFDGDTIVDMGVYEFGSIGVGIEEDENIQPSVFELRCFPNPFSSSTDITFNLIESAEVSIQIFNANGKNVSACFGATLPVNQFLPSGKHNILWNAAHMPVGIYFCRVLAGNEAVVKKMIKN